MKIICMNLCLAGLCLLATGCDRDRPDALTGTVSGQVSYLQKMALPDNAVVTVQLEDVSTVDTPSVVLAEQRIELAGKQVPVDFALHYNRSERQEGSRYAVAARIEVDGALKFITTELYGVSLAEPVVEIDLRLEPVAASVGLQGSMPSFSCQGNEPFWNLAVGAEVLELKRLQDGEQKSSFKGGYTALFGPDGGAFYEWQGRGSDEAQLRLRVLPGHCADSMASAEEGGLFDYSGSLQLGSERLKGCCRLTSENTEEPPEIYACGDAEVAVVYRQQGNSSLILLQLEDGRELMLPQQISASGAKFSDGETVFWNKGDIAMLELEAADAVQCKLLLDD